MSSNKIRIGIIVSEFNYDITKMMLEKAIDHAKFLGVEVAKIVKVPGVFDMPLFIKKLLEDDDIDGVVCIGAVITGETKHDEIVAQHASRKMVDLAVEYGKPVALGVSGPGMSRDQALRRIEEYARRSVEAVVKMIKRLREISK
ncbi:MAG: 6,7-dimethyl-8-ribityllumazine synthase [Candidatus Njordarchaeota archaeon]